MDGWGGGEVERGQQRTGFKRTANARNWPARGVAKTALPVCQVDQAGTRAGGGQGQSWPQRAFSVDSQLIELYVLGITQYVGCPVETRGRQHCGYSTETKYHTEWTGWSITWPLWLLLSMCGGEESERFYPSRQEIW